MTREIRINLIAKDDVSGPLKVISASADQTASSLQGAGSKGSDGLNQVSTAAKQTSKSLEGSAIAAASFGTAIMSAFVVPIGMGTKAAWNQVDAVEQATLALRVYEQDASKVNLVLEELIAFARSDPGRLFNRAELFDAAQGLKVMGAETENLTRYVEIMSRSVSIGAGTWDELGQVIGRIGSTGKLTGIEFDNLTKMGFQLDESLRNTTVTWEQLFDVLDQGISQVEGQTNTIQGQIVMTQTSLRSLGLAFLQVDSETSQFIEGGLGDRMVSGLSQVRDLIGAMVPVAEAAGSALGLFVGLVSDAAYAFSSLPDWLQGGILGFVGLGGAALATAGSLAVVIPRIIAAGVAIRGIGAAFTTALASIGPVGWALIAVSAAVGVGIAAWGKHKRVVEENQAAIARLTDEYLDLKVAADQAILTGNPEGAAYLDGLRTQVMDVRIESDLMYESIFNNKSYQGEDVSGDRMRELMEAYEFTAEESDRLSASQSRLAEALVDPQVNSAALNAEIDKLYWQFKRREITGDEYVEGMEALSQSTSDYAIAVMDATLAQERLNEVLADGRITVDEFAVASRAMGVIASENAIVNRRGYRDAEASNRERRKTIDLWRAEASAVELAGYGVRQNFALQLRLNGATDESNRNRRRTVDLIREEASATQLLGMDTRDLAAAALESAAAQERFRESAGGVGESLRDQAVAMAEARAEYEQIVSGNLSALMDVTGFAGLEVASTEMRIFAMEAMNAGVALDTVFRVVVGNTDAIGNQSDAIHKWALELIGVQGEYSKLDDLVNAGRISGESGVFTGDSEYAQAQRAFNDIARENAEIQEHVLTIQAKQAPIIRDQMAAYENYLQTVADMPAQQQLIALGWMDSTTAMRAMEFQTLAVAAANGELGASGKEVFTDMIAGAASADPVLKALLVDMGLISVGAEGEITVDFSSVEGAQSEIGMLTDSINELTRVLGIINGVDVNIPVNAEDNATPIIRTVREGRDELDGSSATVSIHLNDFASLGISAAQLALNALDGRVATTTIQTIYQNRGIGPAQAHGGMVREYASGGVLFRGGEIGMEMAHFSTGGMALLPGDGYYTAPAGTYISPNNAVSNSYGGDTNFNITVTGGDADQIKQVFASEIVPALTSVLDENRRTAGVM